MSFKTVRIIVAAGGRTLKVRSEPGSDPAQAFAKLKARGDYGVYVVRDVDLGPLRRSPDVFLDRKSKDVRKELAKVMLGHPKIPFVSGGYGLKGRLVQGAEALLRKAAAGGEENVYVVGASDEVFEALWREAEGGGASSGEAQGSGMLRRLTDLLSEDEIPSEAASGYLGESRRAREVRKLIAIASRSDAPVLIMGETGTGKEVVARAIHECGARHGHKFVAVNCGAIPRDLFEAELFGTVGGVATGVTARAGLWEMAGRGTLFLDEVGELSPDHQVKILRALQERKVRRVGADAEREVIARVVAATNRDLSDAGARPHFRRDLYFRLNTLIIRTPMLRHVPEDIPLLAQTFWKRITGNPEAALGEGVLSRLREHTWPGTVRELKSVLQSLYALFQREDPWVEHVEYLLRQTAGGSAGAPREGEAVRKPPRRPSPRDPKREELLLGSWKGTGEDLAVPGHFEPKQKHTYRLRLKLERKGDAVCGVLVAYVKERRRSDEAYVELISVSGDYFSFQYSLTNAGASHYGVMMFHLLPIGDRLEGLFMTKKAFEASIGVGVLHFQKA